MSRDKEKQKAWVKRKYATDKQLLIALKSIPCTDCGGKFPHYMMQFDHVPERGEKKFNIGTKYFTTPAVQNEIAKCDVVCANCHCVRTYFRNLPL